MKSINLFKEESEGKRFITHQDPDMRTSYGHG